MVTVSKKLNLIVNIKFDLLGHQICSYQYAMWATYMWVVSDSALGNLRLSLKLPKWGKMRQLTYITYIMCPV